jgi:hypothetical protein
MNSMENKKLSILLRRALYVFLLCGEALILYLLTPTVFSKLYWMAGGPLVHITAHYVHSRTIAWLLILLVIGISGLCIILIARFRFVKYWHVKLAAIWVVGLGAAVAIFCLIVPFIKCG